MHPDPRVLRISDYTYELPEERIARYPLPQRDSSRLLVYRDGEIEEDKFQHLPRYLYEESTLVLNTATVAGASGEGGTITISHDGRYGDLTGKTVALEPSTGFSFDSPMIARPR